MDNLNKAVTGEGTLPRVISDVEVLQRNMFDAGPRVGRVQRVEFNGLITEVKFWYNNDGSLHHVA